MDKKNNIIKVVVFVCLLASLFVALLPCFAVNENVISAIIQEYGSGTGIGLGDLSGDELMSLLGDAISSEVAGVLNGGFAGNMIRSSVVILGAFAIAAYSYNKFILLLYFLLLLVGIPVMTIISAVFQMQGKSRNKKLASTVMMGVNLLLCVSIFIVIPNFCITLAKDILMSSLNIEIGSIIVEMIRTLVFQIMIRCMSVGFWGFIVLQVIALAGGVYLFVTHSESGQVSMQSVGRAVGKIFGLTGAYAGAEVKLDASGIVFGRDSLEAQIVIDSPKVSRRHCKVTYDSVKKQYIVTDYSSNGTFVGNRRLTKGVAELLPAGTVIALGDDKNTFRLQ